MMDKLIPRSIGTRIRQGRHNILLLGPRQVGKSTLVRSLNPDQVINLMEETVYLAYSKDPGRLKRELLPPTQPRLIVLDEIQRVPSVLNTLQVLIDEGSPHRFLLTGSSARKLKMGGANLLPGRVILEHLDPLSFWELGSRFELEKALRLGTLPGVYLNEKDGAEILSSYSQIYLREEIRAEALTRNLGAYARFLDVAAEVSGDWVNYSKIANDTEIPKETIRRFLSILEDTLVIFRIPPFRAKRTRRRISQRDRFVFFDIGVRNALLGIHKSELSPLEKGKLFEQWIILQLIYYIHSERKEWQISAYRTDTGSEVDIILDTGSQFWAIECKWSRNASEADLKGLRSFEEIAPKPVQKYLVYTGETRQRFSRGETALSYQDFLQSLLK